MAIRIQEHLGGIDWEQLKHDLAADTFDNGRSGPALMRSFEAAQHVAMAVDGERCVGTARMLADGVCNAYLVDVWTAYAYRRQGIARSLVQRLIDRVPGQHIGLQVDHEPARLLYESMGFRPQPEFMALVPGQWLDNEGNR